ncbi:MAG: putative lipid II flippase FtsW [Acidobacteriota bacterium]
MARRLAFDRWLFIVPLALTLFGLLMVYSSSSAISRQDYQNPYHFLLRQSLAASIGLVIMFLTMFFPYRAYRSRWFSGALVVGSTGLLLLVLLRPPIQGVQRWLDLGFFNLQPSEMAKIVVVIALAGWLDRPRVVIRNWKSTLLPCLVLIGQASLLIMLEPDLGTCAILVLTSLLVLYMGGIPLRQIAVVCLVAALALTVFIFSADYRMQRVTTFLNPDLDPQGAGYQVNQALLAIARGGLSGRSLGEGQQKLFFLPEPHTDFIYAVIAEETGFLGCVAVLFGFVVILWRGLRASARAPDRFGAVLGTGLTLGLGLSALINMGVVLALLPTKGLPLPFVSYGGSSLVCSLASIGILLNLSQHSS